MNIAELNKVRLQNGLTRLEHIEKLGGSQGPTSCEGNFRKVLDIPYGNASQRQRYDVYMPIEPGVYPVIFRVHGGGWFGGDRSDKNMGRYAVFAEHGYVVVSIGYRLADEAVFPQPVEDVWMGMQAALSRAEEFGMDIGRISVTAGSAGTAIATLLAVQHPELIRAAVLEASIVDIANISTHFEMLRRERKVFDCPEKDTSIEALYLGGKLADVGMQVEKATPANFITADCPRFLLCHGLEDEITPYLQSVEFARTLCRATGDNNRAELLLLPGTYHGYTKLWNDPQVLVRKLDFLQRALH